MFDQVDTLEVLLPAFTGMVRTMHFDGDRLEEEAPTGFALATDIAEWLVKNGVPFRHAHELSGACVKLAEGRGQELWDLTDNDFIETFAAFLPADKAPGVREVLSSHGSVDSRNGKGGTAYGRVREQIADAKAEVERTQALPRIHVGWLRRTKPPARSSPNEAPSDEGALFCCCHCNGIH